MQQTGRTLKGLRAVVLVMQIKRTIDNVLKFTWKKMANASKRVLPLVKECAMPMILRVPTETLHGTHPTKNAMPERFKALVQNSSLPKIMLMK